MLERHSGPHLLEADEMQFFFGKGKLSFNLDKKGTILKVNDSVFVG